MLDAMCLFLRVVQLGSMSAASKEADLSPASVSRTIASLEERLGVQLFNRTSRKIVLTVPGETYYARIKPLLEELKEAELLTRDQQEEPKGLLRVHAHTSVGIHLVTPRMADFLTLYPGLKVDLQLSEKPVNLLEQNFDVDIQLGELQDSTMLMRRLAPSDRVLVASPEYLANNAPILKPEDLLEHNCVTYRPNSESTTWRFSGKETSLIEVKINGSFHSNNSEVLRRAAISGIGVALLTNWISDADRRTGRLVEVLPEYRVTINSFNNGIFAIYRQSRFVPKKVRVFVDYLSQAGEIKSVFNSP